MDSAVTKVSCRNFRANIWRPHTCTNCYKSKSLHQLQQTEPTPSKSLFKKLTSSPKTKKKELRQVASIATLSGDREGRSKWADMPQRSHKNGPMVGVVKPYAVVDIDEDSETEEESNLDRFKVMKRRYTEPGKQVNKNDSRKNSTPVVPTSSLAVVKTKAMSGSNQSLAKISVTGEANVLETSPKPARVIGRLLNEYHRSMSVTAIDKPAENGGAEKPVRSNRGKSVEPLETHKTQSVSVKRSSSLRQEVPKSSKIMSLLTRRKAASPCTEIKPLAPRLKMQNPKTPLSSVTIFATQPKVTSPHPVRRNKATVYPHSLLVSKKYQNEPSRPRELSINTSQEKKATTQEIRTCEVEPMKRKRTPPPKPPRTLSTFFTTTEQEVLFKQLLKSGDIQDVAIKGGMTNELHTMEAAAAKVAICPPRRLRPGDYDEVIVRPQGESEGQQEQVSRLPLGHSGDYAEVLSSSGTTNESGCVDCTADPDYDSLEAKPSPPTPPPRPHFVLPITGAQPSHSLTSSQDSVSTQAEPSTDSQEHTSMQSQGSLSTQSQTHPSTQSQVTPQDDQDSAYYSLPCTSGKQDSPSDQEKPRSPSIPSTPFSLSQDEEDPYYALPYVPSMEDASADEVKSGKKLSISLATALGPDLHALLASTLDCVVERETEKLVCSEKLWEVTGWEDMKIVSEKEAVYKGKSFSIKDVDTIGPELQNSIKISKLLTPHLHLSLVRSIVTPPSTPSGSTTLTPSQHHLLTDHAGTNTASFLLSQRHTLTHDAYADQVLLTLIQVFSALKHLHTNGVCHRDVGLESVYGYRVGDHWLVKLGDFNYALQRSGPVDATTFVYGYQELNWLGGVDSRLPPEVIDTPENAQTIDYSHTDGFSAGCMVYELCGQGNPFETNPELVFQNYSSRDLPELKLEAKLTPHLQKLGTLLVRRDTAKRVSSSTALLICQAIRWLPEEWLSCLPPEGQVRRHLHLERAQLVCELAKGEERSVSLDLLLKAQFLNDCDVSELIRALSVFAAN